jgi:hypothetical protein
MSWFQLGYRTDDMKDAELKTPVQRSESRRSRALESGDKQLKRVLRGVTLLLNTSSTVL